MDLKPLLQAAVDVALDKSILRRLAIMAGMDIKNIVVDHLTLSSQIVGQAVQNSLTYALTTIAAGVCENENSNSLWTRLNQIKQSKLSEEFSEQIEYTYLAPFAKKYNLKGEALIQFRTQVIEVCTQLAKQKTEILAINQFPDMDIASWLTEDANLNVANLLVSAIQSKQTLEPLIAKWLQHDNLLGDAVLYFLREALRKNERVEKTIAALQRAGLDTRLQTIEATQQKMLSLLDNRETNTNQELTNCKKAISEAVLADDNEREIELNQQRKILRNTLQKTKTLRDEVPQQLEQLNAYFERFNQMEQCFHGWTDILVWHLDTVQSEIIQVHNIAKAAQNAANEARDEAKQTGDKVDQLTEVIQELNDLMKQVHVAETIQPLDEFSHHNTHTLRQLEKIWRELNVIPSAQAGYSHAANLMGSLLSSTGNLERAESLLSKALEQASNKHEKALIAFNLFQIQLKRQDYKAALKAYQLAIQLDDMRYALHDVPQYQVEAILGAGGMGCALLAKNRLPGQGERQQVVFKTLWQSRHDNLKEEFKEAFLMANIAGDYVPNVYGYGYADNAKRRPYLVMQYFPGMVDGERYLQQHGKLSFNDGIQIILQVAKGLQAAHQQGICHLDLKPANLLLKKLTDNWDVKIIDFGLARTVDAQRTSLCSVGSGKSVLGREILGTLEYAPPEQMGDQTYGRPGPHSDIFSLAATLYRLLSNTSPRHLNPRCLPSNKSKLFPMICDAMMPDLTKRFSLNELIKQLTKIKSEKPEYLKSVTAWYQPNKEKKQGDTIASKRKDEDANQSKSHAFVDFIVEKAKETADGYSAKKNEIKVKLEQKKQEKLEAEQKLIEQKQQELERQRLEKIAAEKKRIEEEKKRIEEEKRLAEQKRLEEEKQALEFERGRLSPWSPYSWMKLLWWTLSSSQQLTVYEQTYGKENKDAISKWLVNTILWTPLFLITLAMGMNLIALSGEILQSQYYLFASCCIVILYLISSKLRYNEYIVYLLPLFISYVAIIIIFDLGISFPYQINTAALILSFFMIAGMADIFFEDDGIIWIAVVFTVSSVIAAIVAKEEVAQVSNLSIFLSVFFIYIVVTFLILLSDDNRYVGWIILGIAIILFCYLFGIVYSIPFIAAFIVAMFTAFLAVGIYELLFSPSENRNKDQNGILGLTKLIFCVLSYAIIIWIFYFNGWDTFPLKNLPIIS